jgi:hypothetical protein
MNESNVKTPKCCLHYSRFLIALLVGLAFSAYSTPVPAEIRAELSALSGTYQTAELTGWTTLPDGGDTQGVYLEFSGSQVPGLFRTGYGSWPSGAEIHLYLKLAGQIEWLRCEGNLSPTSGEFTEALPCLPISSGYWLGGPSQFWLYIGYEPDGGSAGAWYDPYPELTISKVYIVANQAVANQGYTWGSVKSLYR